MDQCRHVSRNEHRNWSLVSFLALEMCYVWASLLPADTRCLDGDRDFAWLQAGGGLDIVKTRLGLRDIQVVRRRDVHANIWLVVHRGFVHDNVASALARQKLKCRVVKDELIRRDLH